jgi:hypothetical protein
VVKRLDNKSIQMNQSVDSCKRISIKLWDKTKHDVHIDASDTYDDFVRKVLIFVNPGIGKTLKFIYKGMVINMRNFNTVCHGSVLLCLASISPPLIESSVSQTAVPQEPSYTYKHVKATLVVFLDMIRSNRQLKQLYDNDYGQLVTEIMKNPDLDTMLKNILSQSGQIMNAMEKGENINGIEGNMDMIDLSTQDRENIEEITGMGFNRADVVIAYLSCNKDMEDTLNRLINK